MATKRPIIGERAWLGFALAPILYIIALAGIAGTVLFSGYTQILRSNVEITADNAVRNQIRMASEVLSSQSIMNNSTLMLEPPGVLAWGTMEAARVPRNGAGTLALTDAVMQGDADDVGGLPTNGGVRQLDAWGRYFVMCRWVSSQNDRGDPSIAIVSAGSDGNMATDCAQAKTGIVATGSDDKMEFMSVANVLARSATWQAQTDGTYTFGIEDSGARVAVNIDKEDVDTDRRLDIGGDGRIRGNMQVDGNFNVDGATSMDDVVTETMTTATVAATTSVAAPTVTATNLGGTSGGTVTVTTALNVDAAATFDASLNVTGTTTLGALSAGATTLTTLTATATQVSTLLTSGLATLNSAAVTNGATVGGTLGVTGVTTLGTTRINSLTGAGGGTLNIASNTVSTGSIQATNFVGSVTGNVTGDVTGNAGGTATNVSGIVAVANGGTGAATASGARTNLGLAIGTNVQAWDADLDGLADLSTTGFVRRTGAGAFSASAIQQSEVPAFSGASSGSAGTLGGVPAPIAGQETFILRGDGTWFSPGTLTVGGVSQGDSGVGVVDAGTGAIIFTVDGAEQARIVAGAGADRSLKINGGVGTASPVQLSVHGASGNGEMLLSTLGTGNFYVNTNGFTRLSINGATGAVSAANGFVGNLTGTASTATALANARDFSITGDATATAVSFNGSANAALAATVVKIQGRNVAVTAPNSGEALVWNGTAWAPGASGVADGSTVGDTLGVNIRAKDGTEALPSIAFATDLDTGIYHIGSNEIGLTAGAKQRVGVTGTANDSILRISTPTSGTGSAFLRFYDVSGTADNKIVDIRSKDGALTFASMNDAGTAKATRAVMTNTGLWGLGGVTVPKQTLHMAGVLRFDTDALTACNSDATGSIRWSGTAVQFCDGNGSWAEFASGGGGGGGSALAIKDPGGTTIGYFLSFEHSGNIVHAMSPSGVVSSQSRATGVNTYFTGNDCTGTMYGPAAAAAGFGLGCTGSSACTTTPVYQTSQNNTNITSGSYRTSAGVCTVASTTGMGYYPVSPATITPASAAAIAIALPVSGYKIVPVAISAGGSEMVPVGNDTEVQFNDGGAWGADDEFTWNKSTDTLGVNGASLNGAGFFLPGTSNLANIGMIGSGTADQRSAIRVTGTASTGVVSQVDLRTNDTSRLSIASGGDVSVSSGLLVSNGAVGTPSLRFTNSPTTGLYRYGADIIGFAMAGVAGAYFGPANYLFNSVADTVQVAISRNTGLNEVLRIGTSDSAANFWLTQDESSGRISFRVQATDTAGGGAAANDNTIMTILGSPTVRGVGIGTITPQAPLDIAFGGIGFLIGADSAAVTRTNATQKLARITGAHYTNAEEPVGLIYLNSDATANTVSYGGGGSTMNAATYHLFYTASNGNTVTGTERMRIDGSGNIGIGVTVPGAKLDVAGQAWFRGAAAAGAIFDIAPDATAGSNGVALSAGFATGGYGPMIFKTNNAEAMRILTNGNVGIGTVSPQRKLHLHEPTAGQNYLVFTNADTGATSADGLFVGYDANEVAYVSNAENTDLRFDTNNTERVRIAAAGAITMPGGKLSVGATGLADATQLLLFNIDRAWQFEQMGTGASTSLRLAPQADSKSFYISTQDRLINVMHVRANNSAGGSYVQVNRLGAGVAPSSAYVIDATGDVRITGNLTVSGACTGCGGGGDADTLDTLDSLQFLRSDTHVGNALVRVANGNGNGIRFWDGSSAYSVHMSASGDATYGGRLDATSDYNMYFKMSSGTNRGWVFFNNSAKAQIDGGGNFYAAGAATITGNVQSAGEFISSTYNGLRMTGGTYGAILRTDNSNFYVLLTASGDQSGNWNALRPLSIATATGNVSLGSGALFVTHGGSVGVGTTSPNAKLDVAHTGAATAGAIRIGDPVTIGSNTGIYGRTSGVFTLGSAGGDIVLDTNYGSAERMRIVHSTGNVGIGTTNPRTKLEVNGSIINTTAYNANTNLSGYDIGVGSIAAGTSIYSYGRICSGNASGACSGASGVVIGAAANTSAAINIPTTGDVFFNNGSNVGIGTTGPHTKLYVNGKAAFGAGGQNPSSYDAQAFVLGGSNAVTSLGIWQAGVGFGQIGFKANDSKLYILNAYATGNMATTTTGLSIDTAGVVNIPGNLTVGGTITGSITLGSIITVPGAASNYGAVTIKGRKGSWGGINFQSEAGGNLGTFMANGAISGWYGASDGAWDWYWTGGTLTVGTVPAANVSAGTFAGSFVFSGDARAPIFYDQNNTGYYVDPASTSNVNALTAAGTIATTGNVMGVSGVTPRVQLADTDTGGTRYMYSDSARIGFLSADGNWAAYTDDSKNWFAVNSVQTPIFYDSNNTGYYVDPNGTSNIAGININALTVANAGNNAGIALTAYNTGGNNYGATLFLNANAAGTDGPRLLYLKNASGGKWWTTGVENGANMGYSVNEDGHYGSHGTARFIVRPGGQAWMHNFYDLDNGAYYVDPTGTSNIASLVAGNLTTTNLYVSSWIRPTAAAGVHWDAYGRGFYMQDSTWLREYGSVNLLFAGYYHSSDARLKHDIKPWVGDAFAAVKNIKPVHFKWNNDNKQDFGVIAQDVQKVMPEIVKTDETTGFMTVEYDKLVLPVLEAVKKLIGMVDELRTTVADLLKWKSSAESELAALKAELARVKAENERLRIETIDVSRAFERRFEAMESRMAPAPLSGAIKPDASAVAH